MISGSDTDLIEMKRLSAVLSKLAPAEQAVIEARLSKLEAELDQVKKLAAEAMSRVAQAGGRPIKANRKGQRARISVDFSSSTRASIAKQAKLSGRTLAREAEVMVEGFLQYQQMMEQMKMTLEEMYKTNVESVLYRLGFTPIRAVSFGKACKLWAEPGFQHSGFVPWDEGELESYGYATPEKDK
jgi:hypothetical protein